jgi:hypothetical protein
MKKFNEDTQLKNTVVEDTKTASAAPAPTFQQFLSQFPQLKKLDKGYYSYDDRRVDYNVVKQAAILKKITNIPSPDQLEDLI